MRPGQDTRSHSLKLVKVVAVGWSRVRHEREPCSSSVSRRDRLCTVGIYACASPCDRAIHVSAVAIDPVPSPTSFVADPYKHLLFSHTQITTATPISRPPIKKKKSGVLIVFLWRLASLDFFLLTRKIGVQPIWVIARAAATPPPPASPNKKTNSTNVMAGNKDVPCVSTSLKLGCISLASQCN